MDANPSNCHFFAAHANHRMPIWFWKLAFVTNGNLGTRRFKKRVERRGLTRQYAPRS